MITAQYELTEEHKAVGLELGKDDLDSLFLMRGGLIVKRWYWQHATPEVSSGKLINTLRGALKPWVMGLMTTAIYLATPVPGIRATRYLTDPVITTTTSWIKSMRGYRRNYGCK